MELNIIKKKNKDLSLLVPKVKHLSFKSLLELQAFYIKSSYYHLKSFVPI